MAGERRTSGASPNFFDRLLDSPDERDRLRASHRRIKRADLTARARDAPADRAGNRAAGVAPPRAPRPAAPSRARTFPATDAGRTARHRCHQSCRHPEQPRQRRPDRTPPRPSDRRRAIIELSPNGEQLLADLDRALLEIDDEVFAPLTLTERQDAQRPARPSRRIHRHRLHPASGRNLLARGFRRGCRVPVHVVQPGSTSYGTPVQRLGRH